MSERYRSFQPMLLKNISKANIHAQNLSFPSTRKTLLGNDAPALLNDSFMLRDSVLESDNKNVISFDSRVQESSQSYPYALRYSGQIMRGISEEKILD